MEEEVNLKDYIDILLKQKKLIISILIIIVSSTLILSLLMKPRYEAKATILIRSAAAPSGQFGGLAQMMGINLGSGANQPGDLAQLIKTKTVELMVKEKIYEAEKNFFKPQNDFKKIYIGKLKAKTDGNFLELTIEHKDPKLAAKIADIYVDSLSNYWNMLNYTEARKKREYIEKQLPQVEANLKKTEDEYKSLTYLGPQNTGVAFSVELGRLKREIEIQNSVYTMLRKEYESAKLEESKEISPFSDVEKAEIPTSPSRPRIKYNTMIGAVIGLFIGIFAAFFKEFLDKEYSK